jgi:hypothetical protein
MMEIGFYFGLLGANTRHKFYAPVRLHVSSLLKESVERILSCVGISVTYFFLRMALLLHIFSYVWHCCYIFFLTCGTSVTYFVLRMTLLLHTLCHICSF